MEISIEQAIGRLKKAMTSEADYAYCWHANIAMACYDAMCAEVDTESEDFDNVLTHKIANEGATKFMKMCFGVDTNLSMLTNDTATKAEQESKSDDTTEENNSEIQ